VDGFFADSAGRQLNIELSAPVQNDIHPKATAAVASMWQQLGVNTEQVLIPVQRMSDRQYVSEFPAFQMIERPNMLLVREIYRLHGSQVQLAENRWTSPGTSRYQNPEFDSLLDRFITTIPMAERMEALGAMVHHQTENMTHLPLFYGTDPTMISNRLLNVTARGQDYTQAWNIQDWDIKP